MCYGIIFLFCLRAKFDGLCYRDGSPILVTIVAFWHFAVVRGQTLTPSIAFTSVSELELRAAN